MAESIYNEPQEASETGTGGAELVCSKGKTWDLREKTSQDDQNPINEGESIDVTPKWLHEKLKWLTPIKPILLMSGGLPDSGKSRAISKLVGSKGIGQGFMHYEGVSVRTRSTPSHIVNDPLLQYRYGFLAGLNRNLVMKTKQLGQFTSDSETEDLFDGDVTLGKHLTNTWKWLQQKKETEILQLKGITKGLAFINVWDIAFSSMSLQFLRCFSGHLYNNYMWLFTDIERDQRNLFKPPSPPNESTIRRSRLQYLLRSSELSMCSDAVREDVCTIFAKHSQVLTEGSVLKLQRECKGAANQLGVSKLIKEKITPIDFSKNDSIFKENLRKLILTSPAEIPLSYIFLRGSLELEKSMFMDRTLLKEKAKKCGINEESFACFCRFFTSFGSILDLTLILPQSNIVIIKPDMFLSILDKAFNLKKGQKLEVTRDGIVTKEMAVQLFGPEHKMFLEVLEAVGLTTSITVPQYGQQCYYFPSVRKEEEVFRYTFNAVQLVTSIRYPSVNMEVALTRCLLHSIESSNLILTRKKNVTEIFCKKNEDSSEEVRVTITYQGEVIELMVSEGSSDEYSKSIIKKIVSACVGIAKQNKERHGEAKFHLAILCEEERDNLIPYNFTRKRHILPNDDLCDSCKESSQYTAQLDLWRSAIVEEKIDEDFKLNGSLTAEDVVTLSKEISQYYPEVVEAFVKKLKPNTTLPVDNTKWWCVLMEMITWWMLNKPHQESTKKEMAKILIELHQEFKNQYKEGKKTIWFKRLARGLDLQTLTIGQIKQLQEKKETDV